MVYFVFDFFRKINVEKEKKWDSSLAPAAAQEYCPILKFGYY